MNIIENRKYFDYELAYEMYEKVLELFNKGGLEEIEKEFIIEYEYADNGYIVVRDELNAYNTCVYLINKNFDTDKGTEYYVSGEVDIISYSGGDDDIYINDISSIETRINDLLDFARENNYTIKDYESELESLQNVSKKIQKVKVEENENDN